MAEGRDIMGDTLPSRERPATHEVRGDAVYEADPGTAYWLENAHDLLQAVSADGRFLYVNRAWRETLGYSAEQVERLTLFDIVALDSRRHCENTFAQIVAGDPVERVEAVFIAKGGRRIAVEGTCHLRRKDGEVLSIQGIFRNVTERKDLEAQLRQSQKMEALGLLASGVAHDFGNLLTTVSGTLEWMGADAGSRDRTDEGLAQIRQSVETALAIIDRLRIFSRGGSGHSIVTDLNAVVRNTVQMLERVLGRVHIEMNLCTEPCPVRVGEGHIEQMIMNLSLNARDAMPDGGTLHIATAIEKVSHDVHDGAPRAGPAGAVLLTFRDTGCGMDDEIRQHALEPFFTSKESGKGSGLGLSTVFGIVQQAGGSICLESAPGEGTEVAIRLPTVDRPSTS